MHISEIWKLGLNLRPRLKWNDEKKIKKFNLASKKSFLKKKNPFHNFFQMCNVQHVRMQYDTKQDLKSEFSFPNRMHLKNKYFIV